MYSNQWWKELSEQVSNGDPYLPSSLLYYHPDQVIFFKTIKRWSLVVIWFLQGNEHVHAISSVGNILASYDSDQWFSAWGFGENSSQQTLLRCSINGNDSHPEVYVVQVLWISGLAILQYSLVMLHRVRLMHVWIPCNKPVCMDRPYFLRFLIQECNKSDVTRQRNRISSNICCLSSLSVSFMYKQSHLAICTLVDWIGWSH